MNILFKVNIGIKFVISFFFRILIIFFTCFARFILLRLVAYCMARPTVCELDIMEHISRARQSRSALQDNANSFIKSVVSVISASSLSSNSAAAAHKAAFLLVFTDSSLCRIMSCSNFPLSVLASNTGGCIFWGVGNFE